MFNLLFSPASLQNTKGTIMDQEVTTTFSPTVLHPHRLSLQQSLPTFWALGLEPLRDQDTTLQMTKGTRTWSPTRKPPVPSRAYRVLSSRFQETLMGVGLVLLSPWPVTPATVLQCPTRARRWEKPPPGKEKRGQGPCLGWMFAQLLQGMNHCKQTNKKNVWEEKQLKFLQRKLLWTSFHKLMETGRRMGTLGKLGRANAPKQMSFLNMKPQEVVPFSETVRRLLLHDSRSLFWCSTLTLMRNTKGDMSSFLQFSHHFKKKKQFYFPFGFC